MSRWGPLVRSLPWLWGVFVVTMAGYSLWLTLSVEQPALRQSTFFALPFVSFAIVGAVIASRRPRHVLGWMLLAIPTAIGGWAASRLYGAYVLLEGADLPAPELVLWAGQGLWAPTATMVLVGLPLLFPTGRPLSRRWGIVGLVALVAMTTILLVSAIAAWPHRGVALLGEDWGDGEPLAQAISPLFLVLAVCAIASIGSMVARYRHAAEMERLQIRGVTAAAGLFVMGLVAQLALPTVSALGLLLPLGIVATAVAIGVSVLRYRLYDIDRIISRTVGYVVVTAVLAGLYLGLVVGLGSAARALTGGSSDLVVALSTLAVAAAFQPVRRRVHVTVDRRFNRSTYDAARTVDAFGRELRDVVSLDAIVEGLRRTSAMTFQPMHAAVLLTRERAEVAT